MQNIHDAAELVFHLLEHLNAFDSSLLACVIWSIWKQRNNIIWNKVTDAQNFVFTRANNMLRTGVLCMLLDIVLQSSQEYKNTSGQNWREGG
jgi:hypothetical protein